MEKRNRTLLLILLTAFLLICCCLIMFGLAAGTLMISRRTTGPALPAEGPVIVVTRLVTAVPTATSWPQGPLAATPTGQPGPGTTPGLATPTPVARRPLGDTARLLARAEMPERDLRDLALRLNPELGEIPLVVNPTPPSYQIGDTETFWISNSDTLENSQVTAELRYMTDHVYMWVQEGIRLNQSDLESSAERFEHRTYPTNREFFGSEWSPGVDNDVRLTILHARGLGSTVAGYYSSADEFSRLINPYSNEREMFYISVDPGSAKPNSSFYDGTLAHEFQHMIHWANDRNEDSWVNEGMSMLAEYLNNFDVGGVDYAYTSKPDTQLTTWADPSEGNAEHYGASYLFMAYFLDRFGEQLTKAVVASHENGVAGFDDALAKAGRPERFDDIFADWLIANYLDRPSADDQGRYGYSEIDPYRPEVAEVHRRFPVTVDTTVHQYGADYIRLTGRGRLAIDFAGQPQVSVVDANPPGVHAWWSNRGDDSDATLTHAFDLRGLDRATLTFSAWYDIEEGWDYAYIAVSTDGGTHWQLLPGRYTTDEDPMGNAFGVGWTGISGGGDMPQWVEEEVDLTPFVGQEILLRFEYVTDDAVNEPGLLVDDLAIPELGFYDDGEAGSGGWDAAGWVLMDNTLPQRWLVQLLEVGRDSITLKRMDVSEDGHGQLIVEDLAALREAVLVISALAPVTTEPASYSYTIESR